MGPIFHFSMRSLLLLLLSIESLAIEILRPRGVSLTKKAFYNPEVDFTCFDGSSVIPFIFVNDDYCDCKDGSDEPGTSACPNGFFHCTNAGHKPLNIPSSRVNDGICDCCDASDEYNSSAHCVNSCRELGRKAREEALKHAEVLSKGYQLRQELSADGKKKKEEKKIRLQELEKQKTEADLIKKDAEAAKITAEELEREALDKYKKEETANEKDIDSENQVDEAIEAFQDIDINEDGKLTIEEIKNKWVFDSNKDGVITDDEAKLFLNQKEEMTREEFMTIGWILMKPHYSLQKLFKQPTDQVGVADEVVTQAPSDEMTDDHEDLIDGIDHVDDDDDDGGDEDDEESIDDMPKLSEGENVSDTDTKEDVPPPYDPETQALIDAATKARSTYDEANRNFGDIDNELRDLQNSLSIDLGAEDEFSPLQDSCFEYVDREYTYKLCPFVKATQKPRSGGSEVDLGRWGQWIGSDENKYNKMKYDRGLGCWNGPARSTEVRLSCGMENKITMVSEPNKCEYLFEFATPAICSLPDKPSGDHPHEEL